MKKSVRSDMEKFLEQIAHEHKFEFSYFDGAESVYICNIQGCSTTKIEPEDCGTGA